MEKETSIETKCSPILKYAAAGGVILASIYFGQSWLRKLLAQTERDAKQSDLRRTKSECVGPGGDENIEDIVLLGSLSAELTELLSRPNVKVKFGNRVKAVISTMINDGASKLQVIADFDRTVTRAHRDGVDSDTTYGIVENIHEIPQSIHTQSRALREKYHPMECDPTISNEEKSKIMTQWWTQAHELLLKSGLTRNMIANGVSRSTCEVRDECERFFQVLEANQVPILVFSAGIGSVLREVLRQAGLLSDNVRTIANELKFAKPDNGNEVLIGFENEIIHSLNKEKIFENHRKYFSTKKERINVILLGDMLGDLKMAQGVHNVRNMLTIGFLNDKNPSEQRLEQYVNAFDIVLIDDQSMCVPNAIFNEIIESGKVY